MVLNYTVGVCNWLTVRDQTEQVGAKDIQEEEVTECYAQDRANLRLPKTPTIITRRGVKKNTNRSPVISHQCLITLTVPKWTIIKN